MDLNDEKILKITEKAIYNAEIADLSKFVREQCASEDCPVSVADLARDYITHSRSFKSLHVWMDRIRSYRQKLLYLDNGDIRTKVRQLFVLSAPLSAEFIERLRLSAYVEVDSKNRITKYNDGELILEGDQSQSAKSKIGWAARRVRDKREMEEDGLPEGIKRETPDALEIVIKELLEPKNEIKEEEDISTSEVFNAFLILLLSLNLESLDQLQTKIEKCIEEAAGEKTPSKTIRIALESCLLLVTKRTKPSSEEISLDVFVQHFRPFVISLKLPHNLQQDIKQSIDSIQDKKIPIETVKTALETSLLLLAP